MLPALVWALSALTSKYMEQVRCVDVKQQEVGL